MVDTGRIIMAPPCIRARRKPIMGNGPRKRPRFPGLESRSIAHDELGARAKFAAGDARERVLPGNRGSASGRFTPAQKKKFSGEPTIRTGSSSQSTAEGKWYKPVGERFARHETVVHRKGEYVRGDA
jgi:hypothetical protein